MDKSNCNRKKANLERYRDTSQIIYDYGNKEQNSLLLSTESIKGGGIIVSTEEIEFARLYVGNKDMPANEKAQKILKAVRDFEHHIRKSGVIRTKNKYDKEYFKSIGRVPPEWAGLYFVIKFSNQNNEK